MGKVYARWFAAHPRCRVAAIYNRTPSRAAELAAAYPGARVFERWESLVNDSDIDVVGICTPSHEHLEQVRAALAAGKHVLCEKPMAADVDQCREMVELSRAARSKMMVGFQMRFHPVVTTVDRLLPRIGPIYHVDFNFSLYRPGVTWRHSLLQGGGVLKELSSHLFDLMRHWAGPVATIAGQNRIIETGPRGGRLLVQPARIRRRRVRFSLLQLPRSPLAVHPGQPDGIGRADRLPIQLVRSGRQPRDALRR